MIIIAILSLIIGFALLVKGADFFVEGASALAKKFNIPSIVIGLTIVAFGTSAPEMAVSLTAALKGSNDIAIGNVVGSNVFNTLVVLGMSAAITPIVVQKSILKKDFPLAILGTLLLGVLSMDMLFKNTQEMVLSRVDGVILLICFAVFMYFTVRDGIKGSAESSGEEIKDIPMWKCSLMIVGGLVGIVIGGDISVDGAKEIARAVGMSEALIGLTIVAVGTSLPELVTSVVAAKKGESDIAVGNVLGSNIFNIFLILGTSAAILPMNVSHSYMYDLIFLGLVTVIAYLPLLRRPKVGKPMGITMVLIYVLYTIYLIAR